MRHRAATAVLSTLIVAAVVTTAVPPTRSVEPAQAAKTTTVKMGEYFYRPKTVSIRAGQSIRFVNVGKIEHTVADSSKSGAIRGKIIKPRPLKRGQSQTVRFRKAGTVYYICTFHPSLMSGRVIVKR